MSTITTIGQNDIIADSRAVINTNFSNLNADKAEDADFDAHTAATAAHGATGAVVGTTNTQTLTNKTLTSPTLTTPTIASFTNATHDHSNAAGGGQLTDTALSSQVTVAKGGTGVTSLTAYAPVFGGTTSTGAVQSGTVGSSGEVLTSNGAGALPTFQAVPSASSLIASATQSPAAQTFTVSSVPAKDSLRVKAWLYFSSSAGGSRNVSIQFNGDTASNYSWRRAENDATDTTANATSEIRIGQLDGSNLVAGFAMMVEFSAFNISSTDKVILGEALYINTASTGSAPKRYTFTGHWANTTDAIASVTFLMDDADQPIDANSIIRVYSLE